MQGHGLRFHHFGMAMRSPQRATRFLESTGYVLEAAVYDPLQRVNVQMAVHGEMPDVELIWPGGDESPIDEILKRVDSGIYHCCYETSSIDGTIASLAQSGLRPFVVAAATPAQLFDMRHVLFLQLPGVGLVELLESPAGV